MGGDIMDELTEALNRDQRLRDRRQTLHKSKKRAVEAGEQSLECTAGGALAFARGKKPDPWTGEVKPDTLGYVIRWLVEHQPYRMLGYAAAHQFYEILTCVRSDEDTRYIGNRKLAARREIKISSMRRGNSTLTTPLLWRGRYMVPLTRRVPRTADGVNRIDWVLLLDGLVPFFRELIALKKETNAAMKSPKWGVYKKYTRL